MKTEFPSKMGFYAFKNLPHYNTLFFDNRKITKDIPQEWKDRLNK